MAQSLAKSAEMFNAQTAVNTGATGSTSNVLKEVHVDNLKKFRNTLKVDDKPAPVQPLLTFYECEQSFVKNNFSYTTNFSVRNQDEFGDLAPIKPEDLMNETTHEVSRYNILFSKANRLLNAKSKRGNGNCRNRCQVKMPLWRISWEIMSCKHGLYSRISSLVSLAIILVFPPRTLSPVPWACTRHPPMYPSGMHSPCP